MRKLLLSYAILVSFILWSSESRNQEARRDEIGEIIVGFRRVWTEGDVTTERSGVSFLGIVVLLLFFFTLAKAYRGEES